MNRLELVIKAKAENQKQILQVLKHMIGPTQASRYCIDCRITHDEEDSDVFVYTERWVSSEAINKHICSNDFRQVLMALELCETEPVVRLDDVVSSEGIQAIEAIREDLGKEKNYGETI